MVVAMPPQSAKAKATGSILSGALYTTAWLACLCYLLHAILAQTASWTWGDDGVWAAMRTQLQHRYTMAAHARTSYYSLPGRDSENILMSMLPIAVAAACVTAALWLKPRGLGSITSGGEASSSPAKADQRRQHGSLASHLYLQVKQACGWQLPPRAFWSRWSGGLSVLEALLLVFWAALHIVIVVDITVYQGRSYVAWNAAGLFYAAPNRVDILENIAHGWGYTLWFDLALLFCPIAHNSFINHLTGLQFPALVRYHRWIGHSTMISVTLHGGFHYLYWLTNPELNFWEYALDWNKLSGINFLAGSIAGLCGLVLWVTAMEFFRRRYFEVFYKSHITCFVGFVVFGIIHNSANIRVFLPGLALYFADLVMRICQAQNTSAVTLGGHAAQAEGTVTQGDVVVLRIPLAKDAAVSAGQDLFLLAPSISRWQWHSFTIASVQHEAQHSSTTKPAHVSIASVQQEEQHPSTANAAHVSSTDADIWINSRASSMKSDVSSCGMSTRLRSATLYIKASGNWTQALHSQLLQSPSIPVRVMGPFGAINMDTYCTTKPLLLVAGGVGAGPALAILSELVAARAASSATVPVHVRLLWVARHSEEFAVLDESLARAARDGDGWLSMRLHCTQLKVSKVSVAKPNLLDPQPKDADNTSYIGTAPATHTQPHSPVSPSACPAGWLASQAGSAAGRVVGAACFASGCLWGTVRPMQPQALGSSVHRAALYRLVVLLFVLLGAVMGMVLSYAMDIEWRSIPRSDNTMRWRVGVMYVVIMGSQMIGLPMALVVFPTHLYRCVMQSKKNAISALDMMSKRSLPVVVGGKNLVYHESGVSVAIQGGRPDLAAAVQWAANMAGGMGEATEATVVCAGPMPLNLSVRELVMKHNERSPPGRQGRLCFHQETFEL